MFTAVTEHPATGSQHSVQPYEPKYGFGVPPAFNPAVEDMHSQHQQPTLEPANLDYIPIAQLVTSDPWERTIVPMAVATSLDPISEHDTTGTMMISSPISRNQSSNPIGTNPGGVWFLHEYHLPQQNTNNGNMSLFLCGMLENLMESNDDDLDREVVYRDPVTGAFHSRDGVKRFVTGNLTAM